MSAPIQLHAIPPIGIFKHVDADIRRRLVQAGEFKVVPAHTPLATQGEPHSEMSLIISGKVGIYAHANAQTVQLAELGAGQTVGEMAVIDPHPASADVVVLESSGRMTGDIVHRTLAIEEGAYLEGSCRPLDQNPAPIISVDPQFADYITEA